MEKSKPMELGLGEAAEQSKHRKQQQFPLYQP